MPGPDAPDPLRAALAARAAAAPEEPWLFVPRGGDWDWIGWGKAAARGTLPPAIEAVFGAPDASALTAAAQALEAILPSRRDLGRSRREVLVLPADLPGSADRVLF